MDEYAIHRYKWETKEKFLDPSLVGESVSRIRKGGGKG